MCSAKYLIHPRVGRRRYPECSDDNNHFRVPAKTRKPRKKWFFLIFVAYFLYFSFVSITAASAGKAAAATTSLSDSPLSSSSSSRSSSSASSSFSPSSYLQFTSSSYSAWIPENSQGKVFVIPDSRMGIWTNDTDINIRFKIRSGDPEGFFKAESERVGDFVFLVIRLRTNNLNVLNRERKSDYHLDIRTRVRRKDKSRIKVPESKCSVHVRVTDTNDLDPFFQPSSYTFAVEEDTPLHRSIGRVQAEDADSGINGEIYYSLMSDSKMFAVDPVSGELSLTRPLDYKSRTRHQLTVAAQDRGAKPTYAVRQADTASVTINVVQVRSRVDLLILYFPLRPMEEVVIIFILMHYFLTKKKRKKIHYSVEAFIY